MTLRLPNNWVPRPYQRKFWNYMEGGGKRALLVWPRRHGKDDVCLHMTAVQAIQKTATYWYMLPEAAQARKAIWTAINPHTGKDRMSEAFPPEIVAKKNDQEMFLKLVNGSTVQIVGSDNFNSLVGSPPYGVVFSEWALANPQAWAYLRPILRENGGWAIFNGTPRGRNHHAIMYEAAIRDPEWFGELLTYQDGGIFAEHAMAKEREEYEREYGYDQGKALFEQEYMCSFDAAILGAYFSAEMAKATKEGRISNVPYDPGFPVHTSWDLGNKDQTVIWLVQIIGREWRILGCIANSGMSLDYYVKELDKLDYTWGKHYIPHDGKHKRLGMIKTIEDQLYDLGLKSVTCVPSPSGSVQIGINETRKIIRKAWFDVKACGEGIEALRQYRKEYDEKNRRFNDKPLHDWCSDYADGLRTIAMGLKEGADDAFRHRPATAQSNYDGHDDGLMYRERPGTAVMR